MFTGRHAQLVVMCLQPGEEIGNEVHPDVDQFFRIEQGEAIFTLDGKEKYTVSDGDAVLVPAGTYHNVTSGSKKTLKLWQDHPEDYFNAEETSPFSPGLVLGE